MSTNPFLTNENLFFTVFRDKFLNHKIRNEKFDNQLLTVTIPYLNHNHKNLKDLLGSITLFCFIATEKDLMDYKNSNYSHMIQGLIYKLPELKAGYLKDGLEVMAFNTDTLSIEPNSIPDSVYKLVIKSKTPYLPKNICPPSLKIFIWYQLSCNITSDFLPDGLLYLELNVSPLFRHQFKMVDSLPSSLTEITCNNFLGFFPKNQLPNELNKLSLATDLTTFSQNFPLIYSKIQRYSLLLMESVMDFSVLIGHKITKLDLACTYHNRIHVGELPETLLELFLRTYNFPLDANVFPQGLQKLELGDYNLEPLKPNVLPDSITEMKLYNYNHPLNIQVLPNSLKKLSLIIFSQPLLPGSLPNSLEILYTNQFNHPLLPLVLPESLKKLTMATFNQKLRIGSLPSNLLHLEIPLYKRKLKEGCLPDKIKTLLFNHQRKLFFNQKENIIIPPSVTHLISHYNGTIIVPPSVKELEIIYHKGSIIPPSVETMTIKTLGNSCKTLKQEFIPNSVQTLKLSGYFKIPSDSLPHSVKSLIYGHSCKVKSIPDHVQKVEIFTEGNRPFLTIPLNAKSLKIPTNMFNGPGTLNSMILEDVFHYFD
ncbi:hypothetical protein CYY_004277 [Polysphondylium violaceum]|uniref:FNIP repeat-containing protein n=1 Tax=Polysphondylium violaceum TaxID=133409 RepID=A0A8J4PVP1_9MYCE|nr:hypothetical protein CYY_004277 [Polysphondylium violaceum]